MHNYKDLGLKVGLEIHQQLEGHKLFCKCPCIIKDTPPDFKVKRFLRASVSELGTTDAAALYELKKGKYFVYQGHNDSSCLVELDESPPEELNKKALDITLQLALLLNATIINSIQFMRKIVIDGSTVSGFQRTALVATNGYLETSQGKVSIPTICLEEDASTRIENSNESITWDISRLGVPLIEIATGPDIKTPEHAKETAEKIGMILRSIKGIKRGIGTIRQDVNISIKNNPRIEIKGFQDLRNIPTLIENEISRQLKLIEISEKLKNKESEITIKNLNGLFSNTNCRLIKNVLQKNGTIFGAKLPNYLGILGMEINPSRRFGTELSDYAKVYGVGGLIHSDEDLSKYNLSESEIAKIKSKLSVSKNDAFILIADESEKSRKAINAAIARAYIQYTESFQSEVRNPKQDLTTSFSRPMPGASRMYPETDVPQIKITKKLLKKIEIPELIADKVEFLEEHYRLQPEIAREVIKKDIDFDAFVNTYKNLDSVTIARILIELPKEIKTRLNLDITKLTDLNFNTTLSLINDNQISKDAAIDVLSDFIKEGKVNLEKYKILSDSELEFAVKRIVEANQGIPFSGLMGEVMKKFKGKVDGKKASELIKKYIK